MQFFLMLLAFILLVGALLLGARLVLGSPRAERLGGGGEDRQPDRRTRPDNNLLDDVGRGPDLWPDRTGAVTRHELGARDDRNLTFDRNREEGPPATAGSEKLGTLVRPGGHGSPADRADANRRRTVTETAGPPGKRDQEVASVDADNPWVVARSQQYRPAMDDRAAHEKTHPEHLSGRSEPVTAGARREEDPFPRPGPIRDGAEGGAGLKPEDEFGEARPANRGEPVDQPPTDWHPRAHGAPGQRSRDGRHRSGTAPERITTATDPYAHQPVPGPNHVPPPEGWPLRPEEAEPGAQWSE